MFNMNVNLKTLAVRFFIIVIVLVTFSFSAFSQESERKRLRSSGDNFAQTTWTTRSAGQLIVCVSSDDPTAASYRLKVWQLMQGQTPETAVASNKIVATASSHAIKTKGVGGDRTTAPTNPETIKACAEALQPQEPAPTAALKTRTKSNNANDRTAASESAIVPIIVDNFPDCAKGSSCDYVYTVEALDAQGNPLDATAKPKIHRTSWNVKTTKIS